MVKRSFTQFQKYMENPEEHGFKRQIIDEKKPSKTQASLSNFFSLPQGTKAPTISSSGVEIVKRVNGSGATMDDFPDGNCDIMSWNVNGINAQIEKGTLDSVFQRFDPTILCLQETKMQKQTLDSKKLFNKIPKGYTQYWNCCTTKRGYSGVTVFTKVKPLTVQFDFGKKHINEGRTITLEFECFTLVATYVPNCGDGLKRLDYRVYEWDVDLREYLTQLEVDKNKAVVLTGDLNVARNEMDIFDTKGMDVEPGFTPEERKSFEQLFDAGFVDTFRLLYPEKIQFSYWSQRMKYRQSNRGWRIDYFLMSEDYEERYAIELVDSQIHDEQVGSDHCPVSLQLLLPKKAKQLELLTKNKVIPKKQVNVQASQATPSFGGLPSFDSLPTFRDLSKKKIDNRGQRQPMQVQSSHEGARDEKNIQKKPIRHLKRFD